MSGGSEGQDYQERVDALVKLFGVIASATGLGFDHNDATLWEQALREYPMRDIAVVVRDLVFNSDEIVNVRRVRQGVRRLRRGRIEVAGTPPPPPCEVRTGQHYRQWLSAWRSAVASGASSEQAEVAAAKSMAALGARPRSQVVRSVRPPELLPRMAGFAGSPEGVNTENVW